MDEGKAGLVQVGEGRPDSLDVGFCGGNMFRLLGRGGGGGGGEVQKIGGQFSDLSDLWTEETDGVFKVGPFGEMGSGGGPWVRGEGGEGKGGVLEFGEGGADEILKRVK